MDFIIVALVIALAACLNIITKQRLKINKMKYAVPEIPDVLMQPTQTQTEEKLIGLTRQSDIV